MKLCIKCGESQPLEAFHRASNSRDGRYSYCKPCATAAVRAWREANPTQAAATGRKQKLHRHYRLTPEAYEAMLQAQGGRCAICDSDERLAVDHDHRCCPGAVTCGECIRGLLCNLCNNALERIDAVPDWTERAAAYLTRGA